MRYLELGRGLGLGLGLGLGRELGHEREREFGLSDDELLNCMVLPKIKEGMLGIQPLFSEKNTGFSPNITVDNVSEKCIFLNINQQI